MDAQLLVHQTHEGHYQFVLDANGSRTAFRQRGFCDRKLFGGSGGCCDQGPAPSRELPFAIGVCAGGKNHHEWIDPRRP